MQTLSEAGEAPSDPPSWKRRPPFQPKRSVPQTRRDLGFSLLVCHDSRPSCEMPDSTPAAGDPIPTILSTLDPAAVRTKPYERHDCDRARSIVPVSSRWRGRRRSGRLVACAEAAFAAGLAAARAGNRVNEIGRAVEREVRKSGFCIIEGLTGHGVGRTIHEPPTVSNQSIPGSATS